MDNGSRVNREIYARFCERLEVKSLWPTYHNSWLLVRLDIEAATEELKTEKKQVTAIAKVIGVCAQIARFLSKNL